MSNEVTVHYEYDPLSKEMVTAPSKDNHYRATYHLVVNPNAADLLAGSDELTLTDHLSENLRFLEETLEISPSEETGQLQGPFDVAVNKRGSDCDISGDTRIDEGWLCDDRAGASF